MVNHDGEEGVGWLSSAYGPACAMKLGLAPVQLTGARPSPIAGLKLGLAPVRILVSRGAARLAGAKPSP